MTTTARGGERERTDEGLRSERRTTDEALLDHQADVERDADQVIDRARRTADAILETARGRADDLLDSPEGGVDAPAVLAESRAMEDEAVRDERAVADDTLRRERDEIARALAKLLPLERETTDRYLLSERAQLDDALANRDDFMGIVTHDLRNLLGGIVISAAVVARTVPDDDAGKRAVLQIARIQRYAARMNRLIGDLIDVASIGAGKLAVTPTSADLSPLVAEAVDTFREAAVAKGISLTARVDPPSIAAHFDQDRILQVLANLIANAIKFTPSGGTIVVEAAPVGDEVLVSVSDTGCGIPRDQLEAVFERFTQVAKTDRRGLGLGLYISKRLVAAHGGRIWAESRAREGTRIAFTLPRTS